jgi:hypothetical protein
MYVVFQQVAEKRVPHVILDNERARELSKIIPKDDFAEAVQTLMGNCVEKRDLMEKMRTGHALEEKDWARLKFLNAAPMDKDLFRKVCRTALAFNLVQDDENLQGLLPNNASKIGDGWPLPSPDKCAKILNAFSKIIPANAKNSVPAWMRDDFVPSVPRHYGPR